MKLIFENFENNSFIDTNESLKRAKALVDNLKDLEDYKGRKGLITKDDIESITVYCDDYFDEFYIDCKGSTGSHDDGHMLHVEVLTAEGAESNELEYMADSKFTAEDRKNYKLGETLQWYLPLGDSGFWYCLK